MSASILSFGKRLRQLRENAGFTQGQLANASSIDATTIGRYEQGHHRPQRESAHKLARALGVAVESFDDWTFGGAREIPDDHKGFAECLRGLRENAGLSQRQLAGASSINIMTISKYERGCILPSSKSAQKLALALGAAVGVFADWIMDEATEALERRRRPEKMHDHIRQGYKAGERQRAQREWWIAPRLAAKMTGRTIETLQVWTRDGCPALKWEKLRRKRLRDGNGRDVDFYSERQIKKLVRALNKLGVDPTVPGFEGFERGKAKFHVSHDTIHRLEEDGRLEVITKTGLDTSGKVRQYNRMKSKDLRTYKKRGKVPQAPVGQITIEDLAELLDMTPLATRRLIHREGLTISRGPGGAIYVDGREAKEQQMIRESRAAFDKPFLWGGYAWSTDSVFRERLEKFASSHTLEKQRDSSSFYLDGRASARDQRMPDPPRPILALFVPFWGTGRHKNAWVYCDADGELIKARQTGRISAEKAKRYANNILARCQKALARDPVICNFASLPLKRPGRQKGQINEAAHRRDEQIKEAIRQDLRLPAEHRRYPKAVDLLKDFKISDSYARKLMRGVKTEK